MATSTVILNGLGAYAGQFDKKLIMQMLRGMTAQQDLTLVSNVKSKLQLTKLTVASRLRPFKNTFEATDSGATFSGRELVTDLGKAEWLVDVNEFRGSWLEQNQPDGTPQQPTQQAVPFSAEFWNQQMLALATDADLNLVYNGVRNANGTTAKDITDGFGTIIAREISNNKLVANVTGAIDKTTAVDQVEYMYRRFDAKYRGLDMNVYCSFDTYDKYCDNYRERFKQRTIPDNFLQRALENSGGKAFLKPSLWMGNSGRIIVTPKENLLMATDRLSDMNTIRTQPDMWVLKVGVGFNIGFQIRDLEVIQVNDQA